jgi:hypothetical protein
MGDMLLMATPVTMAHVLPQITHSLSWGPVALGIQNECTIRGAPLLKHSSTTKMVQVYYCSDTS